MDQHTAFLGTGANLGDRLANLKRAQDLIALRVGPVEAASRVYRTEAWGLSDQPAFLNQVLKVRTALAPEALLETVLGIERQMGRERRVRWGARLIDIDILFYDDLIIDSGTLTVPHPFIGQRRFVLAPLAEIAPAWRHPQLGKTVEELLAGTSDPLGVEPLESNSDEE